MSEAFSNDLRQRVIEAIEDGLSTRAAACRFAIGASTAGAWYRRFRDTGHFEALRRGSRKGSVLDAHEGFLQGLIDEKADITLGEMADRLLTEHALQIDPSTIWYFLDRRGITFKKRLPTPANRNARVS